jgi:hypothetical protein
MKKKFDIKQPNKNVTKEQWIGNREPMIRMTVEIPEAEYHKFKMKATEQKKTVSTVVRSFIHKFANS